MMATEKTFKLIMILRLTEINIDGDGIETTP